MKAEARVLASYCEGRVCAGAVLRGPSIDGVLISLDGCEGLALRAKEEGFLGELRYDVGPCAVAPHRLPSSRYQRYAWALDFARAIAGAVVGLLEQRGAADATGFKPS